MKAFEMKDCLGQTKRLLSGSQYVAVLRNIGRGETETKTERQRQSDRARDTQRQIETETETETDRPTGGGRKMLQ